MQIPLHSCSHCQKQFINLSSLNNHINKIHKGRFFKCKKCGIKVYTHAAKSAHRKLHPDGAEFTISFNSGLNFNRLKTMKEERNFVKTSHPSNNKAKTSLKNVAARKIVSIKRASKSKETDKVQNPRCVCPYCKRQFPGLITMYCHINEIHRGRVFVCNKCGLKVSSYNTKQKHKKSHPEGNTFTISFKGEASRWSGHRKHGETTIAQMAMKAGFN